MLLLLRLVVLLVILSCSCFLSLFVSCGMSLVVIVCFLCMFCLCCLWGFWGSRRLSLCSILWLCCVRLVFSWMFWCCVVIVW